jgi:hypothetical protein
VGTATTVHTEFQDPSPRDSVKQTESAVISTKALAEHESVEEGVAGARGEGGLLLGQYFRVGGGEEFHLRAEGGKEAVAPHEV